MKNIDNFRSSIINVNKIDSNREFLAHNVIARELSKVLVTISQSLS